MEYKELNSQEKEILHQQALDAKPLFDGFEEEFLNENKEILYVISKKWLNKWKKYVSYDEFTTNKELNLKLFGQVTPEQINVDIVEESPDQLKYTDPNHYGNVYLKSKIQSEVDYTLLTEQAWNFFKNKFDGITIKRPVSNLKDDSRRVEVMLKQVNI